MQTAQESFSSFSNSPDTKIAPIVITSAVFVGKAVVGGAIGGATSWATGRILDKRFPPK
jgi:hypothetical protein